MHLLVYTSPLVVVVVVVEIFMLTKAVWGIAGYVCYLHSYSPL
jgi:hypothetical protein